MLIIKLFFSSFILTEFISILIVSLIAKCLGYDFVKRKQGYALDLCVPEAFVSMIKM